MYRFILCCTACLLAVGPSHSQQKSVKPKPTVVKPEPLALIPGQPMSSRALTQKPAILQGARGWTVDTRRHRGPIYCFAFSPDEKLIATGGFDATIRIWEVASGKLVRALVGHEYYVISLSFSPDGKVLASGGGPDGTFRLWDPHTGQPLRRFAMEKGYANYVAWAPDGLTLAGAGGTSGYMWIYDVAGDKGTIVPDETGNPITCIAWSPDGRTLAACSSKTPVWLIGRETKKLAGTLGEATDAALTVAWAPDGRSLAAGSLTAIHLFDTADSKKTGKLAGPGSSLAYLSDGKVLAACYTNGAVTLWDMESQKQKATLPGGATAYLLGKMPDSNTLATLTYTTLTLWKDGESQPRAFDLGGQTAPLWTPGRPIISGMGEKTLVLWHGATHRKMATLEGHTASVNAIAWSKDGKFLATGGSDGKIIIWEGATGKRVLVVQENAGVVLSLSWSPDGKQLASGASDQTAAIWDAINGQRLFKLEGHRGVVYALAWSPSGKLLAAGGYENPLKLWNPETGKEEKTLKEYRTGLAVAWSPNGKLLASGGISDPLRFWAETGKPPGNIGTNDPQPAVNLLAWAPNNEIIVQVRGGSGAYLYAVKTGQLIHGLSNWAGVTSVAWSTKGETLATGGADRSVRFWNAGTGVLHAVLVGDAIGLTAIHPEGHFRCEPASEAELIYVVQTEKGQDTLPTARFAAKYKWKNLSSGVKLTN
jgi:WD40 repeat protein